VTGDDRETHDARADRVTDGERIAELLASELAGRDRGPLGRIEVVDVREGVEPASGGAFAYGVAADGVAADGRKATGAPDGQEDPVRPVTRDDSDGDADDGTGTRLADVHLHPDRVRLDVARGLSALAPADERLRVRPGATRSPGAVVFVESGAAVKPAVDLVAALVRAIEGGESEPSGGDDP